MWPFKKKVKTPAWDKADEVERQAAREEMQKQGYTQSGQRTADVIRQATGNELPDTDAMKEIKRRRKQHGTTVLTGETKKGK
jgi:hypothetical protein